MYQLTVVVANVGVWVHFILRTRETPVEILGGKFGKITLWYPWEKIRIVRRCPRMSD
jgi:hypothetical protein